MILFGPGLLVSVFPVRGFSEVDWLRESSPVRLTFIVGFGSMFLWGAGSFLWGLRDIANPGSIIFKIVHLERSLIPRKRRYYLK
jgi:hypothetical protein